MNDTKTVLCPNQVSSLIVCIQILLIRIAVWSNIIDISIKGTLASSLVWVQIMGLNFFVYLSNIYVYMFDILRTKCLYL